MEVELIIHEDQTETGQLTLGSGEYVIGRDPACDVVVASDAVSRRHARLTVGDRDVFVEDLGSANGTLIDERPALGRMPVQSGARIELGQAFLVARWQTPPDLPPPPAAAAPAREKEIASAASLRGAKYQGGEFVAAGGMGIVQRVRDCHVRRWVAMKLMTESVAEEESKWVRFLEEAQVTGQLEHPNIVPVYDLGLNEQGRPFYTMRYVRGINLSVILDDIRNGKADTIAQFPLGRLLTILQKVCDAIAFAHSKGVIHRDIKPENIMIGDFGEALVMDWGLAKAMSGKAANSAGRLPAEPFIDSARLVAGSADHTLEGVVLGTPHFMSPEQANGQVDQIDERADIFMLGGMLYNILTLQFPFPAETAQDALEKIRAGAITPPLAFNPAPNRPGNLPHCPGQRIPESLAAVAMKALAFRPAERYQTVREFQKDIEAYQGGFATSAERASLFKHLLLLIRRRHFEFALIVGASVLLLITGTAALTRIISSERHAQESLAALRAAAPAYESQTEALIDDHQFLAALDRISTAIKLAPERADFYVLKGHILESLLRLDEAREAYRQALARDSFNQPALQNIELCTKLLAANQGQSQLSTTSLDELQAAMLHQQRSAEALAMVRRLGKETQALYDTWKTILEEANLINKGRISPRLIIDDKGLFYLNLNRVKTDTIAALKDMPVKELHMMQTDVRDLTPLKDAPLTLLNLAGTPVRDLTPLRGMPVKVLVLAGCRNLTDLSPLADCRELETLVLPPTPENLESLRKLPNLKRISARVPATAAKDEFARRVARLEFHGKGLPDLEQETIPAAKFWTEWDKQKK